MSKTFKQTVQKITSKKGFCVWLGCTFDFLTYIWTTRLYSQQDKCPISDQIFHSGVLAMMVTQVQNLVSQRGAHDMIKNKGVTADFTDDLELPCASARNILHAAYLQISYTITPSPFHSPLRSQSPSSNLPSFSNIFVIRINRIQIEGFKYQKGIRTMVEKPLPL